MNEEKIVETKKEINLKDLLTSIKMKNWLIYIGIGFYFFVIGIAFMCASLFMFMGKLGFNWMKAKNKKIDEDLRKSNKSVKRTKHNKRRR